MRANQELSHALQNLYFILLLLRLQSKRLFAKSMFAKGNKNAVLSSQTARLNNSQKMKLAENNGIVGTTIFHIATKKVNLFSLQGEDLTFEDNSCVLILGLGKDIQITDYRLQITVYLGSYVCFKQKDKVYNFIIYIIYIIYIIIFLFPDKVVLMRKL